MSRWRLDHNAIHGRFVIVDDAGEILADVTPMRARDARRLIDTHNAIIRMYQRAIGEHQVVRAHHGQLEVKR